MNIKPKYKEGDIVRTKRTTGVVLDSYEDADKYGQLTYTYTVEWGDGTVTDVGEKELIEFA